MLTDDSNYVLGALKLGRSLQTHTTTPIDRVFIELSSRLLPIEDRERLRIAGWKRCTVKRIAPLDEKGTFGRFKDQFSKLHVWAMIVYKTVLYLDSDTIAVKSVDHLLQLNLSGKHIGAAHDFGEGSWRPTFNMGVFVIHPNMSEYNRLVAMQRDPSIKFETAMCEQGFLNVIYSDAWEDIGFVNNANLAIYSQDQAYWNANEHLINIIHYTMNKPWNCGDEYAAPCELWKAWS